MRIQRIREKQLKYFKDNKGATLVELMVAIAIGAIVIAGIAYIIVFSMRMYGKSSATVDLQNEAQSTLNYIVDSTMQASGMVISYDSVNETTEYVLYGKLYYDAAQSRWMYQGIALVSDTAGAQELYLTIFPNASYPDSGDGYSVLNASDATFVATAGEEIRDYVLNSESVRKASLMANNITKCYIYVEDDSTAYTSVTDKVTGITETVYVQPFGLIVDLEFEKDTGTGMATKSVRDSVNVRNSIGYIYVNGNKYGPLLNNK